MDMASREIKLMEDIPNKEDMGNKEVMAVTSNKVGKEYLQKSHLSQNYLLCLHNHL